MRSWVALLLAILLIGAVLFAAALPGHAQDGPGNASLGRALALRECSECHVVEGPPRSATDPIPAFVTIANGAEGTVMALRAFLRDMHPSMPDIMLGREEEDDVIAYILTLRDRR
jgi:mono/diheme cytochrome c family protein